MNVVYTLERDFSFQPLPYPRYVTDAIKNLYFQCRLRMAYTVSAMRLNATCMSLHYRINGGAPQAVGIAWHPGTHMCHCLPSLGSEVDWVFGLYQPLFRHIVLPLPIAYTMRFRYATLKECHVVLF